MVIATQELFPYLTLEQMMSETHPAMAESQS
jgi:hypothetical protein